MTKDLTSVEELYSSLETIKGKMQKVLPDMTFEGDIYIKKVTYRIDITNESHWDTNALNIANDFAFPVSNDGKTISIEVYNAKSTEAASKGIQKFLNWVNAVLKKAGQKKRITLEEFLK